MTDGVMLANLQVLKFGGTSVKNLARIKHVAEVVTRYSKNGPVLVVVSAMGDTTDYLIELANRCSSNPDQRELDSLLSTGEQISTTLLTMMLHDIGTKAQSLTASQAGIITAKVYNNARITDIKTNNLMQSLSDNDVVVVAGFQGVTTEGDITTLGRGGSDTTAVALAAATGTGVCEIYTDVDGIYTADPAIVSNAKFLSHVSYDLALEMACMGAQIIHPRAVSLASHYNIKLRVRNTFNPDHLGTIIDGEADMEIYRNVSSIALDQEQSSIAIIIASDQPGSSSAIMTTLAENNIITDMIMQNFYPTIGAHNITFTINTSDLSHTLDILEKLKKPLGVKEIISDRDLAKVSLIGTALIGQTEVAAKLFNTLNENNVIIKMLTTSERKITCVVDKNHAAQATHLIHQAFEL